MKIYYPAYYFQFSCLAGACPDSCCKEWQVDVDPDAAALYRSLPGALGERLRRVLQEQEDGWASMAITPDRRCPMWRQDGLCDIQATLGHNALCVTCREFPRLRHDYGDFGELDLELSCPEAARLILSDGPSQLCVREAPDGEPPEYDPAAMDLLLRSRDRALALCRESRYNPGQILSALLLYACDVRAALEEPGWMPEAPDVGSALERIRSLPLRCQAAPLFDFYQELEILTPQWGQRLAAGPVAGAWHPGFRPLIAYFIRRYWLQAISDQGLVERVKFLAVSCLMIRHLGGDFMQTAQQYSKEIENDADNVDRLLEAAYTEPAFSDLNILGLLLQ